MTDPATSPPQPACGVVVIGRNEGERLRRCLASLAPLGLPVVYVDSASTDGSRELAMEMGVELVDLDLSLPFTAARARNSGFARLREMAPDVVYVQFVDGDCEVEKDWIAEAVAYLDTHADFVVACGRRRERFPEASFYNALCDDEWNTPIGEALACGGDACMRIADFVEVGGFDDRMVAGEEPELCHRLRARGGRIMRLDAAMTTHDAAMTRFRQWWLRAVRSGFGYAQAWHVTRKSDRPLYGREVTRTVLWAGALPFLALILALAMHPAALLLWPVLTLAQWGRLTMRLGPRRAFLSVAVRYAELSGVARHALRAMRGNAGETIVYK